MCINVWIFVESQLTFIILLLDACTHDYFGFLICGSIENTFDALFWINCFLIIRIVASYAMGSMNTEHISAIQIFQYNALKYIG